MLNQPRGFGPFFWRIFMWSTEEIIYRLLFIASIIVLALDLMVWRPN